MLSRKPAVAAVTVAVVLALVTVVAVIAVRALTGDEDDGTDPPAATPPDMFTGAAIEEFLAAVREETGATEVFDVAIYRDHAAVSVPVGPTGSEHVGYLWDGRLSRTNEGTAVYDGRFALADLDPKAVLRVLDRVRALVGSTPASSYVTVSAPAANGVAMSAFASGDADRTALLTATLDGQVVKEYPPARTD